MTKSTANTRAKDAIKIKSGEKSRNRTCHTNRRETLIRLMKVTIDVRDTIKRRAILQRTLLNYAQS